MYDMTSLGMEKYKFIVRKSKRLERLVMGFLEDLSLLEIEKISDLPYTYVVFRLRELSKLYPELFPIEKVERYKIEIKQIRNKRNNEAFKEYMNKKHHK